ncbi:MAG TPA: hypothetical protein PLB89_12570 [Flavobacteriales bacterium]|nr:hypothetical protein [Flavobacteriales bacterium]
MTMKHLVLALFCLFVTFRSIAQEEPAGQTLNAIVTVQVSGMDEALWTKISARVAKEPHANVEYSCTTTGIIVVRLQKLNVTEKADVMTIVKRMLHEAGVKGQIDFLDVHVAPGVGDRC